MANELNHIIVHCQDRHATATFLTELLDAPAPVDWSHFTQVTTSNAVGIDFADGMIAPADLNPSHLAFLVTDDEFDEIFGRITERELRYWADPMMMQEGKINHHYGGRGVYLRDPGGTVAIEFITRPYGEVPEG